MFVAWLTHGSSFPGDICRQDLCLQFRLAHRVVEASGSDDKVSEIRRRALCGVLEIKVIALDAQLRFVQHCVADDLVVAKIHATRLVQWEILHGHRIEHGGHEVEKEEGLDDQIVAIAPQFLEIVELGLCIHCSTAISSRICR